VGVAVVGGVTASASVGVTAGGTLSLATGRDAILKGAVAQGRDVVASVGRDLSVESVQDTSSRKSTSAGFSAGLTLAPGAGLGGNGGVNVGKGSGSSSIVSEQTALIAREGRGIRATSRSAPAPSPRPTSRDAAANLVVLQGVEAVKSLSDNKVDSSPLDKAVSDVFRMIAGRQASAEITDIWIGDAIETTCAKFGEYWQYACRWWWGLRLDLPSLRNGICRSSNPRNLSGQISFVRHKNLG
jgi:hypothetical protein